MMGQPLLAVSSLSIEYHTLEGSIKAVEGVSFQIDEGETICLVGESGSGKSTVGLAIAGGLPENAIIRSGKILYKGRDLLEFGAGQLLRKEIMMIFQDPSSTFNPLFTIGETLSDVIRTRLGSVDEMRVKEESLGALKAVGLPDSARVFGSYPHELSGGMLQRAAIAIALSVKPSLLIADEPTTMLDVTLQAQILELLMSLKDRLKLSMLFITHNLGVASEIGDRIIIMYAGRIVEEGSTGEVLENPLHPYTKGLLECVPQAHIKRHKLRPIPGMMPNLIYPPMGCPFYNRCPYAMDKCKKAFPPPAEVSKGHATSCYLYP